LRKDLKTTSFIINEHPEKTKQVTSLIGTPLQANLLGESNATSLIVGSINCSSSEGTTFIKIALRNITNFDEVTLNRLAKQCFKQIIEVYGYEVNNLNTFWDKLQEAAPPDIRQTQNTLLKYAIISLRSQLGSGNSDAKSLIRTHFELDTQREEILARQEKYPDHAQKYRSKLTDIDKRSQENKQALRKLIEEDKVTQTVFLDGVRQRIIDASYNAQSIPFELFQNADDACCQLKDMRGDDNVSRFFSVTLSNNKLLFSHWGRAINQYSFKGQDHWEQKEYNNDLLNILLLNFSDKSEGVTGKFGLGFKTVFLLSATPRVISDRIGFEVIGGIYPRQLTESEFKEIERERQLKGEQPKTLIQLNVKEAEAKPVIENFAQCAPLLGAFSRWLREFNIRIQNDKSYWKWLSGAEK
jgi:hypothetical protein